MSEWQPIETAPRDGVEKPVDLWINIHASPMSMGWADAFRVPDAWYDKKLGGWVHYYSDKPAALRQECITHWMPIPEPPK